MPQSNVIRNGVIPALITFPLTGLRAWLEVNHPGGMMTTLVSLNVFAFIWIIYFAVRMRRRGDRFRAYLPVLAAFCAIYRGAIGAVYTLAWAQNWKTPDGTSARYQRDMLEAFAQMEIATPEHASAGLVFAVSALFPILTQLGIGTIIWVTIRLFVKPPAHSVARD